MSDYKTVYPPVQPEHLTPNQLYTREYAQGIWIPLLQNFFGGLLGAGGFVGIIAWKVAMTEAQLDRLAQHERMMQV